MIRLIFGNSYVIIYVSVFHKAVLHIMHDGQNKCGVTLNKSIEFRGNFIAQIKK